MFKKIFLIMVIIALIGGIGYALIPKEEKNKIENKVSSIMENTKTDIKVEKLTLLTNGKNNYNNKGYYYINIKDENVCVTLHPFD